MHIPTHFIHKTYIGRTTVFSRQTPVISGVSFPRKKCLHFHILSAFRKSFQVFSRCLLINCVGEQPYHFRKTLEKYNAFS